MNKSSIKYLVYCFAASFLLVGVLGGISAWLVGQAQFLGKDVSTVALGMVQLYPKAAVMEGLSITLAISSILTLVYLTNHKALCRYRSRIPYPAFFAVFICLAAYGCIALTGVIKYPALFEATLGSGIVYFLISHLGWCSPTILQILAIMMSFFLPLLHLLRIALEQRRAASVVLMPLIIVPLNLLLMSVPQESRISEPNVLFISIDSLRTDRAYQPDVMPHLTQLLNDPQTVQFKNHYVGIPRTFPSWIEIITGRHAAENGIRHMFPGFKERSQLMLGMVTAAKNKGYDTSVFSDFAGDIFPRFKAGFDTFHAPKLDIVTMIRLGVDQASPLLLPFLVLPPLDRLFLALKSSPAYADAEKLTDTYLRSLGRDDTAPRFDLVFYSTAHFPYAAPYPYYKVFTNSAYSGRFHFQKNPEEPLGVDRDSDIAQVRSLYDGGLKSIDDQLNRLFKNIKDRGLWDNTLIIVTADHGENLYEGELGQGHGEHLRGEHVLKVPFILKMPQQFKVKKRVFHSVSRAIDVAPTVSGILGHRSDVNYRGSDLSPWFMGTAPTKEPKLLAYSETGIWFSNNGSDFYQKQRMQYPGVAGVLNLDSGKSGDIVLNRQYERLIVTAKHRMLLDMPFKIIFIPTNDGIEWELYNQKIDPLNSTNLAETEPHLLKRMKMKFWAYIRDIEREKASIIQDYVVPK